ncbi:tRNA (mnm(5)s(2)U34)-methyltransferase [Limnoglobus roseus]|uniref:Methyltransferase domain-containing protein n=1 Tax=Limnoglobus roseus TaxID=2598579 RepID=A0A5C1AC54_9BACT|nr:class I SAM-dependent methyltransferase [Limnoglobus roseus]QEL16959.1 methyltransferase domain-containing protein [Limnoglobus roseus]
MDFTLLAHQIVCEYLRPGEIAIDATVGNGHDAKFLAELVGPTGRVYGFDVQPAAIARAEEMLAGCPTVSLFLADHAEMAGRLPADLWERVGAVMFNLGYLPRGDRTISTSTASTVRACDDALSLLRPGGVLTVMAYRGHPGGREETEAVRACFRRLPAKEFAFQETPASAVPTCPVLFVVRKLGIMS